MSTKHPEHAKYITMDISEDSIAFLGKNSIYGTTEGFYNSKEKIIFFPGDCGAFQFEYKLRGGKLYLKNYLEDHIAERCDSNCCNKLIDFKHDLRTNLTFPKVKTNIETLKPFEVLNKELLENISLGIPKELYNKEYGDTLMLELSRRFATINDISKWVEHARSSRQEAIRDRISFRILADKNLPVKDLMPVINELKKNGVRRIFFTCLKANYETADNMFEYVFIERIDLDEGKTLQEILK